MERSELNKLLYRWVREKVELSEEEISFGMVKFFVGGYVGRTLDEYLQKKDEIVERFVREKDDIRRIYSARNKLWERIGNMLGKEGDDLMSHICPNLCSGDEPKERNPEWIAQIKAETEMLVILNQVQREDDIEPAIERFFDHLKGREES